MTIKQKELCNVIESLPEELSNKVVDYIEYLKFSYMTNKAPDNLIIKDNKDLLNKLKKVWKILKTEKYVPLKKHLKKLREF